MSKKFDLIIRGATCVSHAGIGLADVAVHKGRTAAIGNLANAEAAQEIDAKGLHLLPGVIDTQVHFREPGAEPKEDLATGSLAAVLGGVTGVFEMPNTKPSTTTAEALADKVSRAQGRMWCDFAFYMGASSDNATKLAELERLPGCAGIKVFMGSSTGDLLVWEDEALEAVLSHGTRRVAIHAEDELRLRERKHIADGGNVADHPLWRDEETALMATRRILELARRIGRRIHVLHVTTAEEMALLADYKDVASVEATPQHLTLEAPECYKVLGTFAQMNPPIRSGRHRDALWQALGQGVVDVIGSDHAPHLREEKAKPYPQSPSGMPGVQTLLPLLLNHLNEGRLTLEQLVDLTSAGAQRLFNLAGKGRLAVGYDADYTLVDLKKKWTIEEDWLASKCGWSPFTGMKIIGQPAATIIRGNRVMWQGEVEGTPQGRPIRFQDTLAAK
jgi:dihydroorotase